MSYNLTQLTNADTITDLFVVANDATGTHLFGLFLIAIFFVITLLLAAKYNDSDAVMAAAFICFTTSLLMRGAGLINFTYVMIFLAATAFIYLYKVMTKN